MSNATDIYRTPDDRFVDLPGFPFEPHYEEIEGLRLHFVDEGDGDPVLLLHGEPTWSFLYRKIIAPLSTRARVVAPDLPGFGRSDKPTDLGWYSYDRHTELTGTLLTELDLHDATVVVHDWGGAIGLRLAVENPDRISRIVIMDSGLFTGEQPMSDAWHTFRNFVERTEDLPISLLVRRACARGMDDSVAAAYDAPFPTPESKAGPRAFPLFLPTSPDMPGAAAGKRALQGLRADARPTLVLWADKDMALPFELGEAFAKLIGAEPPTRIDNASHFVQEDAGEEIGALIADWLR
jgi:haloalkane dehalogenase